MLLSVLVIGVISRIIVGDKLDPYLWVLVGGYFLNLARIAAHTQSGHIPFKLPSIIAGLVILQGFFGMWTVTLNLWPQVVTAHLLGGFATLSLLWLLLQRLGQWHWQADANVVVDFMNTRMLSVVALGFVIIQIAIGGWLSSNYAALACPDFPLCQNQIWPQADFSQGFNFLQSIGPNYLGGIMENQARIAIHLAHRIGAIIVLISVGLLAFRLWRIAFRPSKNFAIVLTIVLTLQLLLGILNIVLSLPLFVAVAHNAVGAVLLIALITINHRLRTVKTR